MRVVCDTNVIVSAFLWQLRLKLLYQLIKSGTVTPCFSDQTWRELERVLSYQKLQAQLRKIQITREEMLKLVGARARFFLSAPKISLIPEDPSDNLFLACALSSRAAFLISGDRHLLQLNQFRGIPIVTPRQFLRKVHQ